MPDIRLPNGQIASFPEGTDPSDMLRAIQSYSAGTADNPPPPGVMVHERNRSYITGGGPSVDTTGMSPERHNEAIAGLAMRANTPGWVQALAPVLQGVSMGYGDEAVSAVKGLENLLRGGSYGWGYNVSQEAQRQLLADERAQHPVRSVAGQVAGSAALAPLLAPLAAGGEAMPLAARMAAGAAVGGPLGAVQGFGSGNGLDDRLTQAATGGLMGAAIGGAVPAATDAAKAAANKILDTLTVSRNLRNLGINRPAADAVMRAMNADDALSGAGAANIAAAGPGAMLVDAGPSARGALDQAMQRGGPATRIGQQAVGDRMAAATGQLNAALDRSLGAPQGSEAAIAATRQGTQAGRQAAYDAAYNAAIDYSAPASYQLTNLLKRVPESAVNQANALMRAEGVRSRQILARIGNDGSVTFERLPDVRQLDYITRGLGDVARAQETAGALGGRTNLSRIYGNLASDIRSALRELVPEYGVALDTAADPITRVEATRFGAALLRPSVGRDEVALEVKNMTAPQRDALRQGVRSYIDDLMANTRAAASDPNQDAREGIMALRQLGSRAASEKLAAILDPKEALALSNDLTQAAKAAELYAGVTRNSATYGRMAVAEANKQLQEPGLVGSLMEGRPVQASQRALQYGFGRTPQDKLAQADEMNRQIAALLTGPRGTDAVDAMRTLSGAYLAQQTNANLAKLLAGYAGAAGGLGAYQGLRALQPAR